MSSRSSLAVMPVRPGLRTRQPAATSVTVTTLSSSATVTTEEQQASSSGQGAPAILRLRGAHASSRSVSWAADVIDNEGLGRKKSKVCCIYRRPRPVDESSDESDSDSDSSDSDSEPDLDPGKKNKGRASDNRGHDHENGDCHGHNNGRKRRRGAADERRPRRPSPNAYERVPQNRPRPADDSDAVEPREAGSGSHRDA